MPIGISEDHAELAGSIRKWAEALQPRELVKSAQGEPGVLAAWSQRYAEMGLATIAAPEPKSRRKRRKAGRNPMQRIVLPEFALA